MPSPARKRTPAEPVPRQSTELELVQQAITGIDKVSQGLAELSKKYGGIVYDVTTATGMTDARAARAEIRAPRYEVERIRKQAKAPILALGRKLDAEAGRIEAEILKIEGPIDAQIKAEEERIEAERQAKVAAEARRLERIQSAIDHIRGQPARAVGKSAVEIFTLLTKLEDAPVTETEFQESTQAAHDAKAAAVAALKQSLQQQRDHEAERERVARESEELRKRQAEQERIEGEARAKREAEQRRLDKQAADLLRQEEEFRRRTQPVVAPEPPQSPMAVEAVTTSPVPTHQHPGEDEIVAVLANHYKVPKHIVAGWLLGSDFSGLEKAA